jgi:hypothetical protein
VKPNPKAIGERSEAAIIAKLLLRGDVVLMPFGDNQRYDLVIERDGRFVRVQCKTGRIKNGVVAFNCCSNAGGYRKRSYRGEIDLFAVFCPENGQIYLVPVDDVPNTIAHLRIDKTEPKGPKTTIRWADKYLMP